MNILNACVNLLQSVYEFWKMRGAYAKDIVVRRKNSWEEEEETDLAKELQQQQYFRILSCCR